MFLYLLVFLLLLILIFNFLIVDFDYMHPSVLFVAPFLLFGITSILAEDSYEIIFHKETLLVLVTSTLVFTLVTLLSQIFYRTKERVNVSLTEIKVNKGITFLFIIFFIITQLALIK